MTTGNYTTWQCKSSLFMFSCSAIQYSITVTTSYRFSDQDLMMRFRGRGVGHKSSQEASNFFKKDRDRLDVMEPHEQNDDLNEQHQQTLVFSHNNP